APPARAPRALRAVLQCPDAAAPGPAFLPPRPRLGAPARRGALAPGPLGARLRPHPARLAHHRRPRSTRVRRRGPARRGDPVPLARPHGLEMNLARPLVKGARATS